jgi:CRISPR-associated protein Cas1
MLAGRLGLETARIPYVDRHGLMWLERGGLYVEDGCVRFKTAGSAALPAGDYGIPFQTVSLILLGPGSTISHDALRILARHGTGLIIVGTDGVRMYASLPEGMNESAYARRQAQIWATPDERQRAIRRLYAWRLGEVFPNADVAVLRGMEGVRMKETYRLLAQRYGVQWKGRRYNRSDPEAADLANQAINHAATAVEAAAAIAVAATSTIPQLGFIHEASSNAFTLDIADLFRDTMTLPIAFHAVKEANKQPQIPIERHVRCLASVKFRQEHVVDAMITRIKSLLTTEIDGAPTVALIPVRPSQEDDPQSA